MKVSILLPRHSNTSVVRLCDQLSRNLRDHSYESSIVFLNDFISFRRIHVLQILQILMNSDVVITTGALSDIFSVIVFPFKCKPHVISYIHCFQWPDLKHDKPFVLALFYFLLWRLSLFFKSHIVCVSNSIVKDLPAHLRSRSSVIYNHIDLDPMSVDLQVPHESILPELTLWKDQASHLGYISIFTFGFFVKRKNIQFLIRYLAFNPNSCLVLIGGGPLLATYKKLALRLNVYDRILFIPFLKNPSAYSSFFDVYISPSFSEGFGLANVEAACTGITTIVPDLDVNLEVLSSFPRVYFYNNNSLSSLHRVMSCVNFNHRSPQLPSEKFSKAYFNHSWLSLVASYVNHD